MSAVEKALALQTPAQPTRWQSEGRRSVAVAVSAVADWTPALAGAAGAGAAVAVGDAAGACALAGKSKSPNFVEFPFDAIVILYSRKCVIISDVRVSSKNNSSCRI